jgi:hypothetical protein
MVVLINGEPTKSFRCERGIRQGCPLSPLLFILVLEGLSILLKHSHAEGKLSGVNFSGMTHILHILFVDDVLILTEASFEDGHLFTPSLVLSVQPLDWLSIYKNLSFLH